MWWLIGYAALGALTIEVLVRWGWRPPHLLGGLVLVLLWPVPWIGAVWGLARRR